MDKNEVKSKKISTSELWAKLFRSASVERYLAGSVDMQELPLFSEYISMLAEERNEKAEKESMPILLPTLLRGLLSNFDTTNISGKAPDNVTHALTQIKAAFSNVSKCSHTGIFVRNVNTAHASPIIATHRII